MKKSIGILAIAAVSWLWVMLATPTLLRAQGTQMEFGKNRVQYANFNWWKYETEHFVVYWHEGGRNIGQAVVMMVERDYKEVSDLLEYKIGSKIEVLVYDDLTDLKQSNIGTEEVFINTGGVTKIVDNKLFVYFDGNHHHLRRQLREGIAQVYLNYMMFGGNLQEIVQNAVLFNLPEWFTSGLVTYAGETWSTDTDNRLKDGFVSGRYKGFEDVVEENPRLAGQSFWHFLALNYGKSTVSNLLYLTRINRNMESGFLYVLGGSFEQLAGQWYRFYEARYRADVALGDSVATDVFLNIKNKRQLPLLQVKISPNGRQLVYAINEAGKYKVWLTDAAKGNTSEVIYQFGSKNIFQETDYNYPIVEWLPNSQQVAIVYEKRDEIRLLLHDIKKANAPTVIEIPNEYQRILNLSFINSRQAVVTAMRDGFSDIFVFDLVTRQSKPITRDYHDDLDAVYVHHNGKRGIVFSSNRPDSMLVRGQKLDSLLPLDRYDLFFYDLEAEGEVKSLVRITNTPYFDERQPMAVDSTHFAFLSNANGLQNRHIGYIDTVLAGYEQVVRLKGNGEEIILPLDSVYGAAPSNVDTTFTRPVLVARGNSYPATGYTLSLLQHHTAPRVQQVVEVFFENGASRVRLAPLSIERRSSPLATQYRQLENRLFQQRARAELQARQRAKTSPPTSRAAPVENMVIVPPKDTVRLTRPSADSSAKSDSTKIDLDNYYFQSEFEDDPVRKTVVVEDAEGGVKVEKIESPPLPSASKVAAAPAADNTDLFRPSRILPYHTSFKTDYVTAQLDNTMLFGGLQPIDNADVFFDYPIPSILLMGSVNDLFEDYQLQGGVRIPTTLNGSEYFVIFNHLKKRLDKRYSFYRRNRRNTQTIELPNLPASYDATYRIISNIAEAQFKYPLDVFRSFRLTLTGRTDRQVFLATDQIGLGLSDETQQRVGIRFEYVFDNALDVMTNIKNGSQAKIYAETQKRFDLSFDEGLSLDFDEGLLGIVGFDARHYQRLDKYSIAAFRAAGATSFGTQKILYYLGGVDNWLAPKYRDDIPLPADMSDFAYQTIATNMRGFASNIRNGNSFAVVNAELRVPFIRYLTKKPLNNSFLNNLQAIAFLDVGTAWQGLSPFSTDNPLNTVVISDPNSPVSITVNYFRNPIVAGYGAGVRTMLFGYFVRADYARGIETGILQDPIWHVSLGLDF